MVDLSFIPDGKSWEWEISTFIVWEKDKFSQMISMQKSWRYVPEWTYKRLTRNWAVIMSNTPDEIRDFSHFTCQAHWNILINGLWLWCVLKTLIDNTEVTKITIIEKSEDVIKLVSPYFNDERLTVINADAFDYEIPKWEKYDFVWHDIWDDICADNLPEMTKLHRKYWRKTKWQDSWAKYLCLRNR